MMENSWEPTTHNLMQEISKCSGGSALTRQTSALLMFSVFTFHIGQEIHDPVTAGIMMAPLCRRAIHVLVPRGLEPLSRMSCRVLGRGIDSPTQQTLI